ncbi:MAG: SdrD B-like domain-containing protein [Pirellulaceae bacterium]
MIRRSRRANIRRHRLSTPSQTHRRFAPRLEALESRQMLAGDDVVGDVIAAGDDAADELTAGVSGRKWEDRNANGLHDPGEPGLPGVIIYADLNRNGQLDRNEPFTRTSRDIPETDFDEAGLYTLGDLPAGPHVIREVVPDLYEQTFPPVNVPILDDPGGVFSDEFASVEPERLVMRLDAGQVRTEGVAVTVHPFCIRPIDVDVVSSDPDVAVKNLSGVQQNGCGGDATKFEVALEGDGTSRRFQLHFVDSLTGTPFAAIPVLIMAPASGGAHHVILEAGQHVDGLHFGNRYVGPARGSIMGTKWLDANGDAEQDPGEPGIAGVTIYLDLNFNNELDPHEPTTTTSADNPLTDFDEAGWYRFGDVDPGRYAVREVVPEGSIQTYPQLIVIDPLPPLDGLPNGASHFVAVRPGEAVTGIDFGNRPKQMTGDFDEDAVTSMRPILTFWRRRFATFSSIQNLI